MMNNFTLILQQFISSPVDEEWRSILVRNLGSIWLFRDCDHLTNMTNLNPCFHVKQSCNKVVSTAQYVRINDEAIERLAKEWTSGTHDDTKSSFRSSMIDDINNISWDSSGWHYNDDAVTYGPLTCQYIFVLDSLNFCFWEQPFLEYDTLAIALRDVLRKDTRAFDAIRLSQITEEEIRSWFPLDRQLPNMYERVRVIRELGQALLDDFDGLAAQLVAAAKGSAVKLVNLVIRYLPGFRDFSIYKGFRVDFYKRAQILVGDLWAAYGKNSAISSSCVYSFPDIGELTMFADYRVPQILRHYGILTYVDELSKRIDSYEEIPSGCEEEIEIRATTVVAVEKLKKYLDNRGVKIMTIEVDWLLWQQGETVKDSIKPHHRTKTVFY